MAEVPFTIRIESHTRCAAASSRAGRPPGWPRRASAVLLAVVTLGAPCMGGCSPPPTPTPRRAPASTEPQTATSKPPVAAKPPAAATDDAAEQLVDDATGSLLWASPTAGPPPSLAYVPGGAQCLVHVRPAMLAAHGESERIMAALGPWGESITARLKDELHAELREIDSLFVAIVVGPDGGLDATLRATFLVPLDATWFASHFPTAPSPPPGERGELTVLNGRAMFVSPEDPRTLIVCPEGLAAELIESGGEPPPLVRDVESLVAHADADRAATIIVAAKFLQAGGAKALSGDAATLHAVLPWLLDADATAAALSAHWGDDFFIELRATPALNVPPRRLAALLQQRIAAAPPALEDLVLAFPWHPHGREVLARLPEMMRTLARFARPSEDDRQALVRAYLPVVAGHNLLMATELLLTQPRADALSTAPPAAAAQDSLPARLERITSLSFTKDSLERALELLAEDVGVDIVINGADLQLDGITKNQSLGLDLRDRPAAEILVEILLRANPDRTAAGPDDPRQKLVYVLQDDPAEGSGRIIVTTRAAAAKRNETLPSVFVPRKP